MSSEEGDDCARRGLFSCSWEEEGNWTARVRGRWIRVWLVRNRKVGYCYSIMYSKTNKTNSGSLAKNKQKDRYTVLCAARSSWATRCERQGRSQTQGERHEGVLHLDSTSRRPRDQTPTCQSLVARATRRAGSNYYYNYIICRGISVQ